MAISLTDFSPSASIPNALFIRNFMTYCLGEIPKCFINSLCRVDGLIKALSHTDATSSPESQKCFSIYWKAAANAACLAIDNGCGVGDVDIRKLQANLEKENVMIHFPDEYVAKDAPRVVPSKRAHGEELENGHF